MSRENCGSWMWHFLGVFTLHVSLLACWCFHTWRLFCHYLFVCCCFFCCFFLLLFFLLFFSSLLLFMSREGCASWLWHFLGIFTYMFYTWHLFCHNLFLISLSFDVSGGLCFVIVAISWVSLLTGFSCCFCFILICSSTLFLLMSREDCASWIRHFLGIFTYMFYTWHLFCHNLFLISLSFDVSGGLCFVIVAISWVSLLTGFSCCFCFILICSSTLFLLMSREDCASWIRHFLSIFTYMFYTWHLFCHNLFLISLSFDVSGGLCFVIVAISWVSLLTGFSCCFCFILICSSTLFLLMSREDCASWIRHFLSIFTYMFYTWHLFCHNLFLISLSFDVSGGLCFVIVAISWVSLLTGFSCCFCFILICSSTLFLLMSREDCASWIRHFLSIFTYMFYTWHLFCHNLFLISLSFDVSGGLCFVIVAISWVSLLTGFSCCFCFILICSSTLFLLMSREDCASWIRHFLSIFTYMFYTWHLFCHNLFLISLSFDVSGGLCFVIVAISWVSLLTGFSCCFCFILICSSTLFLLMSREDCASWIRHFLSIFTYRF